MKKPENTEKENINPKEYEECCEDKTKEMESKIFELENNWKRALADYKNLEKRVAEEKQEFAKYFLAGFIRELLAVLDNLEKAQEHTKDEGVNLVVKDFREILKKEGVEEIIAQDTNFDPLMHDAVEVGDGIDGKILKVLEKGYKIGERILRPAKVVVGKSFAAAESVGI